MAASPLGRPFFWCARHGAQRRDWRYPYPRGGGAVTGEVQVLVPARQGEGLAERQRCPERSGIGRKLQAMNRSAAASAPREERVFAMQIPLHDRAGIPGRGRAADQAQPRAAMSTVDEQATLQVLRRGVTGRCRNR